MPFQKENQYSKGRPKGTPNKLTAQVKDKLQYILNQVVDSIDIEEMDITEKMRFIQIASQYVMPRLKQVDEIPKSDSIYHRPTSILIYTHRDEKTGEWIKREEKLNIPNGDNPQINWIPSGVTEEQKEDGLTEEKFDELYSN